MKDAIEYCGICIIAAACGYWLLGELNVQLMDLLDQTVEMITQARP